MLFLFYKNVLGFGFITIINHFTNLGTHFIKVFNIEPEGVVRVLVGGQGMIRMVRGEG